jgi:nicotinate dehydrogenase subunit A
MNESIQFILNSKPVQLTTDSDRKLLWVIRTDFGLTGTKYGCGIGVCGACTVLVDNIAVRSCQLALKSIKGKKIITIEGLSNNGKLHPIQKAFMQNEGFQCGYCTSGMILEAYSFLQRNANPSYTEIVENMDNHLCRCGAHNRIIEAIQSAASEMRGKTK